MKKHKSATKKIILVLSMHRCGSSCCAGAMQFLGAKVSYGKSLNNTTNQWNEKGYYENEKTFKFHKKMLRKFNTTWKNAKDLSDKEQIALMSHTAELMNIIKDDFLSVDESPVYIIKDPRIIWIFDVYLEAITNLGLDLYIVHLDRPDDSIAKSLSSVTPHKLTYQQAMDITKRYKKKIEECLKKVPHERILQVTYSDILSNPVVVLAEINKLIGMSDNIPDSVGVCNFIDKRLKHY